MDDSDRWVLGAILIVVGVVFALFGDRNVPVKGGVILKLFSAPEGQMRWLKWLMGGALVYAGVAVIFRL